MYGKNQYGNQRGGKPEIAGPSLADSDIPAILNIRHEEQVAELLDKIKGFVENKGGSITSSQLRNIFSKVKGYEKMEKGRRHQTLQLIRPHLAYIAARQNTPIARDVVEFLESIVKGVDTDEKVDDFVTFFESIVAYHKFYHGKKS